MHVIFDSPIGIYALLGLAALLPPSWTDKGIAVGLVVGTAAIDAILLR